MSDIVWQALIAAILAAYLEWSRRKTAEKVADLKIDLKADAKIVKDTLAESTKTNTDKVDTVIIKLDDNTVKTEKVVEQTNGLTDVLKCEIAALKAELATLRRTK